MFTVKVVRVELRVSMSIEKVVRYLILGLLALRAL
jgi:hypothetical protein